MRRQLPSARATSGGSVSNGSRPGAQVVTRHVVVVMEQIEQRGSASQQFDCCRPNTDCLPHFSVYRRGLFESRHCCLLSIAS
jgi:hypothetical protein